MYWIGNLDCKAIKPMQSRSLLLISPNRLEWITETLPPFEPDEILVQTTSGAISIGAELPPYRGIARSSTAPAYPHMTGYESVGTVLACGSKVQHLRLGDRIVAFYGHCTHGIVPAQKAIFVPPDVSDALALLAILTCDVSKGITKINDPADHILITGAGAIGLLTLFMLRYHNPDSCIDIVEPRAERRELALLLGATTALSPNDLLSHNSFYRVGYECSSYNAAFALLQQKMLQDGRICILSDGNLEALTLTPDFHEKELHITGSSDGLDYPGHAKRFFAYVSTHNTHLERLFDHQISATDLPKTFAAMANGTISPLKVLVKYLMCH